MITPTPLVRIDTAVQELRLEQNHRAFTRTLAHIVSAIGAVPDLSPAEFTGADLARLRELVEETIASIERRIDSGADQEAAQQPLAGTIYEIRRRMETVETWITRRRFA